jgi:hypothetical protein
VHLVGPAAAEGTVSVLTYVGTVPAFASPTLGSPIALSAVRASGRRLPEFDNVGMLAHVLEACDLVADVRSVVTAGTGEAPTDARDIAGQLMRYLNGQWWYRHHTGDARVRACERLEARIVERMNRSRAVRSGAEGLAGLKTILSADAAVRPDSTLRLDRVLRGARAPMT